MSSTPEALFQPFKLGDIQLAHRVVHAPLTRLRADDEHVHTDLALEYHTQRACVPGTLLITEGTFIAPQAGGIHNVPGIWSDAQVAAWKKIADAVHAKGSYIYLQLWALGRAARVDMLHKENPEYPHVAPSPIALKMFPDEVPRELTKAEIREYVEWYATAAKNAVHRAGFDGVEVHGANGYLVDQFIQDVSNHRTDEYGGSVENRARFALEVMDAITATVGQSKAAIRLSPWNKYQDMRMDDPIPTFTYLVEQLKQRYPDLAYLHVITADEQYLPSQGPRDESQEDFVLKIWAPRIVITTGAHNRASGLKAAESLGVLVGYGRAFLANPDLPFRLRRNLPLNEADPKTFYLPQSKDGYVTYPFSKDLSLSQTRAASGRTEW